MKKLMTFAGVIAFGFASFAQRPVDVNPFSFEGGLSITSLTPTFNAPTIRFRYFATDNIAGRLGIMHSTTNVLTNHYGVNGTSMLPHIDSLGTERDMSSMTTITLGGSYHFSQSDRLSPYALLDLMIGFGSTSAEWRDYDGTAANDGYNEGYNVDASSSNMMMGVNIGAGVDYYFAQNLFIGAEFGFGYTMFTDNGGEATTTVNGVATTIKTHPAGDTGSIGNNSSGNLRIGWRF